MAEDDVETLRRHDEQADVFISLLGRGATRVSVADAEEALTLAKQDVADAQAQFDSWISRILRLVGAGGQHRERLEAARDVYLAKRSELERAREDSLIARNVARLVQARVALEHAPRQKLTA